MRPQKPKTLYHLKNAKSTFLSKKFQKNGGEIMSNEEYKKEIIRMVEKIETNLILKLIYGFVKSGYNEERAGK